MNELFSDILKIMPERLKVPLMSALKSAAGVYEIRLVADQSFYLVTEEGIKFLDGNGRLTRIFPYYPLKPAAAELDEIVDKSIGYSGFFRERELKNGFISFSQGIRIGLCTDMDTEKSGVGRITSLNIRIPYYGKDDINADFGELLSFSSGLLIAGAPSSGKTTLLREIAKRLSSGFDGKYEKVCVIDERGELTSGKAIGVSADVIRGMKKSEAILHALRLLSPKYIICDEIGGYEETKSILEGLNSGVSFIASIHAGDIASLVRRRQFRILFSENVFDRAVLLSCVTPGKIDGIYTYGELLYEIGRSCEPLHGNSPFGALSFISSE